MWSHASWIGHLLGRLPAAAALPIMVCACRRFASENTPAAPVSPPRIAPGWRGWSGWVSAGGGAALQSPFNPHENTGLGWTFDHVDGGAFRSAVHDALYTYRCPPRPRPGPPRGCFAAQMCVPPPREPVPHTRPSKRISPSYLLLSVCGHARPEHAVGTTIRLILHSFPDFIPCHFSTRSCHMMMTYMHS